MAFITLIVGAVILGLLFLLSLAGIICLVIGITFSCLCARDKKNGSIPQKWKTQAAMICNITGGICLAAAAAILLFLVI
ncbi:MAG: hypothetical protein K2P13_09630 [Lachnospiraceae bacterium]|nr:hypothetical protein [Lachnospiraceae bacterium]MDE6977230.1 hypothetical protein [Lachnospiraceae bacterium]